jgi:hypothetical protein
MFSRRARWVWSGVLVAVVAFYGASVVWYAAGRQTTYRSKGAEVHAVWIGLGAVGWTHTRIKLERGFDTQPWRRVEREWGRYEPTWDELTIGLSATWPLRCEVYPLDQNRRPYGLGRLAWERGAGRVDSARVALPLWPLIPVVLVPVVVSWRRHWRTGRSRCGCGYPRAGLPPDGLCPECGASATV